MEHWISRNSHQWSTWLATQWHLTPYHVSIITNQSKQSLNEFEQQGFSQACLTPLMRYWCLHCLHSFFFFYNGKRKKINSFTAVYHCSHRKSIGYSLWRPSLSPAYGHQKLDKPHGYTGQIQQQFPNHFEQLCPRVHICNFIINTVIKLPERSCTTWYNLILSKCRI